jgi:glycosidase
MCGAPAGNADFTDEGLRWQQEQREQHRILRVLDWIDHIKKLGATCVMFNPVFDSDAHGYDTRDYRTIDPRLGTNDDFKKVCDALHDAGLKVMLDGVLNHVGRGFSKFRDVQEKKWDSPYKDWFNISFDGNTAYNDGFWYDAWEGCYELVKLNLQNTDVRNYLFDSIRSWVAEYGIDGLRLDVAYLLDRNFLRGLRNFANELKPDFVLMGETLHGDYNIWMNDEACNSVTNYECYKGLYSSFNS